MSARQIERLAAETEEQQDTRLTRMNADRLAAESVEQHERHYSFVEKAAKYNNPFHCCYNVIFTLRCSGFMNRYLGSICINFRKCKVFSNKYFIAV